MSGPSRLFSPGLIASVLCAAATASWSYAQTDGPSARRVLIDPAIPAPTLGPFEIIPSGPNAVVWYDQHTDLPWASISRVGLADDRAASLRPVSFSEFWPRGIDRSPRARRLRIALDDGRILAQHVGDAGGAELWSLDPATGAWSSVAQTVTGPIGGEPRLLTRAGRYVYFVAHDDSLRERLYRTDGTSEGSRALTAAGAAWSLVPLGDSMMVSAYLLDTSEAVLLRFDNDDPFEPATTTTLISAQDQFPRSMVAAGARVELALATPLYGTIVWRSDGSPAGTWGIGWAPGMASLLAASDDESAPRFLSVYTAGAREELWSLTPQAGPTRLSGSFDSISDWAATSTGLVFSATPIQVGSTPPPRTLWTSDGTLPGTGPLLTPAGDTLANPTIWCSDGAHAYFTAHDAPAGAELWSTDGRTAGTSRLTDIAPGPASANPHDAAIVTSRLYFAASDGTSPDGLWMIDLRPADFNNDGSVSAQDVLDFLTEFLAGRARADFNGVDGVSVEDLLAWMTLWFAGRG